MKITFLGTAAAEGVPSLYCECPACKYARDNLGKDLRMRSCILINDDLLVDMGPDLVLSCAKHNISLNNLKYVIITHAHFDHFYPENLEIRSKRYQPKKFSDLTILANSSVFYGLSQMGYKDDEIFIKRMEARPYEQYQCGEYIITPIYANHAHEYGMAFNYIIQNNNKTILYATDTGIYHYEWLNEIKKYKFDCVIIDATNVFSSTSKNHLNIEGIQMMIEMLGENKNINSSTKIVASHFSHYNLLPHCDLEKKLKEKSIITAYDGMLLKV